MKIWKNDSSSLRTVFDLVKKRKRAKELEKKTQNADFWQAKEEAVKISQELAGLKEELKNFEELKIELELLKEGSGKKDFEELEKKLKEREFQFFLSGEYDSRPAILSIFAGAGGQDAQDWATMLLRMYERYAAFRGFKTKILHQSFGEAGGPEGRIGTKQAFLEIKGKFAYGFFKKETGVHRLVRISPFSPKKLRHTSFALVEVLPEIPKPDELDLKIRPEDLKIEFYRASGPGGQYVNKRETSVRITHLPTGVQASCQSERLQGDNRKQAMGMLVSKLFKLRQEAKEKELRKIKGEKVSASWGNQIRSYVVHPYKLAKDLRTGTETSNVEAVLDGNLDEFIEAEIKTINS